MIVWAFYGGGGKADEEDRGRTGHGGGKRGGGC